MGHRTCYYRTFSEGRATEPQKDAYKRARDCIDQRSRLSGPTCARTMWPIAGLRPRNLGLDLLNDAGGFKNPKEALFWLLLV